MKISCIQMNVLPAQPEENFVRAKALIRQAAQAQPDVILLPETWTTGFFPQENLAALSDRDGLRVKAEIGSLAGELGINIVAGSAANLRDGKVYNTAMVFDRQGRCVAEYDKTHLFSPMGEQDVFQAGDHLCRFTLDGVPCGMIICYDVRFPELSRALAQEGMDVLFMVSQWGAGRTVHLRTLTAARAIENQVFLACCNGCGVMNGTQFGGCSAILDPWGATLALAGEGEEIITASCDFAMQKQLRTELPLLHDRRTNLYALQTL